MHAARPGHVCVRVLARLCLAHARQRASCCACAASVALYDAVFGADDCTGSLVARAEGAAAAMAEFKAREVSGGQQAHLSVDAAMRTAAADGEGWRWKWWRGCRGPTHAGRLRR